jgi:hypothetical protein
MFVSRSDEEQIAKVISDTYDDPFAHVMLSYPWGSGSLRGREGPQGWQEDFLRDIAREVVKRCFDGVQAAEALMYSTSSGHGIGKSALVAWLIRWILDTRPFSKGVVTANTGEQLRTKTWAELAKWHGLGLTKHWWHLNSSASSMNISHVLYREQWRCDAQTCREENSEAFAGLHAANSTPFYIFDEASGVPDKIFEVREGGLTDGEPMVFDFGNPTRNSGRFHQNMVGRFKSMYKRRFIDSRDVEQTNKALFDKWAKLYGEDSDFFRVRVKGLFPVSGTLQFIPMNLYDDNVERDVYVSPHDPIIIGVDVARFGDDRSVIWTRQGRDAESHGYQIFREIDTMTFAAKVAEKIEELRPDAVFVDGGGVGGGVVDRLRQLGHDIMEINFGSSATDSKYRLMRDQMWGNMREALQEGVRLPDDEDLRVDLTGVEYGYTLKNQISLEAKDDMKKRGLESPDLADALALTYALPVGPRQVQTRYGGDYGQFTNHKNEDYDPF